MKPIRNWTWFGTRSKAPIPSDGLDRYKRAPLFGNFANGFSAFGPYRRPIEDATGGGQLVHRQLAPFSPNIVAPKAYTPVAITGSGSELTGEFSVVGLINVNSAGNGSPN